MAVTKFQSSILNLLASSRKESGESYVAGGVALNLLLNTARRSRDIDLFHDTEQALFSTWQADRQKLSECGYSVHVLREAPSFVEAMIELDGEKTAMQWARDSAFRFFPLIQDDLMGFTLHPIDLATNKALAMVGRLEVRDWIDVLNCDAKLQPLGYLVWAACGKDPGFNPRSLLAAAQRLRYSQVEVDSLDFDGPPPDAVVLGQRWHAALRNAEETCTLLPASELGTCVVSPDGKLYTGDVAALVKDLESGKLAFHAGSIRGSWPKLVT